MALAKAIWMGGGTDATDTLHQEEHLIKGLLLAEFLNAAMVVACLPFNIFHHLALHNRVLNSSGSSCSG
jgi:hypothetical protein